MNPFIYRKGLLEVNLPMLGEPGSPMPRHLEARLHPPLNQLIFYDKKK